jgi:uncharacterized protein YcbX
MAFSEVVGSVVGLWRFPVKSMRGEQLQEADVTERGILGDRAYALIDKDTGKVVSAKSVKLFPDLLNCKAAFVEPPSRVSAIGTHDVHARAAERASPRQPVSRAQVPHERDHQNRTTRIHRERLGRSWTRAW